jgi:hypothetical protein
MSDLQQDLGLLRGVVESRRRAVRIDTAPLLAWGVLTVAGVIGVYTVPRLDSVWFWLAVIGLAWAYTGLRAWTGSARPGVSLLALFGVAVLLLVVLPAAWMRRSDVSAG